MAIASVAALNAAYISSSKSYVMLKSSLSTAAGQFNSTWTLGTHPTAASAPTSATICNNTTTGGFILPTPPFGAHYLYEVGLATESGPRSYFLYDRIAHRGSLSGTTTTSQTVGVDVSAESTRIGSTDFSEVEWWTEWYTGTGSTGQTATFTYTNGAGTSGQVTTLAFPSSPGARRMLRFYGLNGEPIQSVQSVIHGSTGTAGAYGVTAMRYIGTFNAPTTADAHVHGFDITNLAPIPATACLFWVLSMPTSLGAGFEGSITLVTK